MIREEALTLLDECIVLGKADPEAAHGDADKVLCDLLVSLGYQDVVDSFNKVEKWYA